MEKRDKVMSREALQITYRGALVDSGLMDVRDLGPALFSIGELCRDANNMLNGPDSEVCVKVKADFKKGSFQVDLDVVRTLIEKARDLFTGNSGISTKNIIEILFGAGSVIAALKWLKGEKDPVTTTLEDGSIKLEVTGKNNHIIVNSHVAPLLRDPKIRRSIDGLVRPLDKEDMESFSVKQGKKTLQTVKRADAKYLLEDGNYAKTSNDSHDVTRTAYLEIIRLSFIEKNRWTFSDGSATFSASIEDPNFSKKIDSHEMFGKGDQLKVTLRTTTGKNHMGKYQSTHTIVQVLDIVRSRQTNMFNKKQHNK